MSVRSGWAGLMRRSPHFLAVVATVLLAGTRGRAFLPDQLPERLPAAAQVLVDGFGHGWVTVYAGAWLLCAALSLLALRPNVEAVRWLVPTVALSLFSSLLYIASWVNSSYISHDHIYERAWTTGSFYGAVGLGVLSYTMRTLQPVVPDADIQGTE